MYPRLLKTPRDSVFLFGPRGTGKSTWLRERFPQAASYDLLDTGDTRTWNFPRATGVRRINVEVWRVWLDHPLIGHTERLAAFWAVTPDPGG